MQYVSWAVAILLFFMYLALMILAYQYGAAIATAVGFKHFDLFYILLISLSMVQVKLTKK